MVQMTMLIISQFLLRKLRVPNKIIIQIISYLTNTTFIVIQLDIHALTEFSASLDTASHLKYFSLVTLMLQNAVFILMMRYVRTRPGDMFMSTTAVIMSEVLKFLACFVIIFYKEGSVRAFLAHLEENIIKQPLDCLKICVPSIIYTLQNNLLFVAVSNLDAAVFQVNQCCMLCLTVRLEGMKYGGKAGWEIIFILNVE